MDEVKYTLDRNEGVCESCGSKEYKVLGLTSNPYNSYLACCNNCGVLFDTSVLKLDTSPMPIKEIKLSDGEISESWY